MRTLFFSICLTMLSTIHAQNTYATIVELNNTNRWLRSDAAETSRVNDRLLLYQQQGATINLTGSQVGEINDLNGAGHFDLNQVVRISGDTLFLALPIKHTYAVSASQLVIMPDAVDFVQDASLTAPAFNGTTGGVLFLAAEHQLTISAQLSAAALGFRGGIGQEADSECSRFTLANGETYSLTNWRGSARGEGIAGVPSGQEAGRAPAGNGGGGGNDHNAGGGGGANTTNGGIGAINVVTGLFNNACRGNFPGRGGRSLGTSTERLYLGGGGGAGHANNTETASGGNGGGLVVLWAPNIVFTADGSIDVSGGSPAEIDGDGGGGGGAGGSVLIVADTLRGAPELNLSGGKGADVRNASDRCFGPGGGGSGGRLLIAAFDRTAWTPTVSLSSGGFGLRLGSDDCAPDDSPGGTGETGTSQSILFPVPFGGITQSADTLCANQQLLLTDASNGAQQVSWEVIPASEALTTDQLGLSLRVSFADSASGTFRAIQTLFQDGVAYPGDTATFTVFPVATAAGGAIEIEDEFATASVNSPAGFTLIRYDFGDGTIIDTTANQLMHTYLEGGDYTITITLLNEQCGDLLVSSRDISLAEFAIADTDAKTEEGCAPYALRVNDLSTGEYAGNRWDFPGATPAVLFDAATANVVYAEPGAYQGSLTLLGALGPDTVITFSVLVTPTPVVDFTFSVDTATAVFQATSDVADTFEWNFGDGQGMGSGSNPTYAYDSTGTFTVTLEASLGACVTTITRQVTIDVLSDIRDLQKLGVTFYPNPTAGVLHLTGEAQFTDLFDVNGRHLQALSGNVADLTLFPPGNYLVRLRAAGRQFTVRVLRR